MIGKELDPPAVCQDEQQAILSVGRARLNATLGRRRTDFSVEFRFEQKVTGLRRRESRASRQRVSGSRPDRRC